MVIWKFIQYRFKELIIWLGIPVMGVFFSGAKPDLFSLAVFLLATVFFMAHTLLLNDWAGQKINPAERTRVGITAGEYGDIKPLAIASAVLLLLSIALYSMLEIRLLVPLTCGVVLSLLYSHPAVHMKGNAVGSFILHLLGGEVKFLLGFLLLSTDILRGLLLGLFLSLIFSAGSLVHQCLHESEDREAGLDTGAVRFGTRKVLKWAILLFMFSHVYLLGLSFTGKASWELSLVFSIGLIAHFRAVHLLLIQEDSGNILKQYQKLYRNLYGAASLVVILWLVMF